LSKIGANQFRMDANTLSAKIRRSLISFVKNIFKSYLNNLSF